MFRAVTTCGDPQKKKKKKKATGYFSSALLFLLLCPIVMLLFSPSSFFFAFGLPLCCHFSPILLPTSIIIARVHNTASFQLLLPPPHISI